MESKYINILEEIIWDNKPVCPRCGTYRPYKLYCAQQWNQWKCRNEKCRYHFNVLKGTVFENCKLDYEILFCIIANYGKWKSESAAARSLGITQRSMWLIVQKIKANPLCLDYPKKFPHYFEGLKASLDAPVTQDVYLRNKKQTVRYRKENPEKIRAMRKKAGERDYKNLPDWMIRQMIKTDDKELIEVKRLQIILKREIKNHEE